MKVIYLTGAPTAGKSSTLRRLQEAEPSIFRFEYGIMTGSPVYLFDADQDQALVVSSLLERLGK